MRLLITGGVGFIGSNATVYFRQRGHDVVVLDNFSRVNVEHNLAWVEQQDHLGSDGTLTIRRADIRDPAAVAAVFRSDGPFDGVLHLAAQVAVTTSVRDPRTDFETNAVGTFNLLEACRTSSSRPAFIYASTNKVYGKLEHLAVRECRHHYEYMDAPLGVSEQEGLDFYSPYGCSKGAADQYVRDYARIYGLPTVVMRQSCIYGQHQFGVEDQGWVAWFIIAAITGRPITIYGDGKQARDLLWVDDLIAAYERSLVVARERPGSVYNVGGGTSTVLSLVELLAILESELGRPIPIHFADWRPGDQRLFVADVRKARQELDWSPIVQPIDGARTLIRWVRDNVHLFEANPG